MAVPKKRTGHSAQGKRRSNWKAIKPATTVCPNCGETVLAHTVCTSCGTYKGKPVSKKGLAAPAVEAPKAEKAPKVKEEVKAEVVEEKTEVKAEEKAVEEEKTSTEE